MTQQIALARYRPSPRYRVRHSMHAFGHDNTGLVSGHLRYSPRAFGFNNRSGLVPTWTRYSPYAFGTKHNGLILDPGCGVRTYWLEQPGDREQKKLTQAIDRLSRSIDNVNSTCQAVQRSVDAAYRYRGRSRYASRPNDLSSRNPRLLMRAHLNEVIPGQYKVSDLLRVDQEVVSFNVVIENKDLVIKYWNPKVVQSIQRASNQKTEQLSDYMKAWAVTENFYDNKGGKVVHIVSADQDEILMELTNCLQIKTM